MRNNASSESDKGRRPLAVTDKGHGSCPLCGNLVSRYRNGHEVHSCQLCGLALDWEEKTEMSIDEQTKIENEWCVKQFATHQAKLIQDTDRYFIADWRRADGNVDYYINFILDKKRGSLIISGDVGACIATWYNALTLKNLNSYIRHDVVCMS